MDPFVEISRLTKLEISPEVIAACVAPKLGAAEALGDTTERFALPALTLFHGSVGPG